MAWLVVSCAKAAVAEPSSVTSTAHWPLLCSCSAVADVTCEPRITALPRTYLSPDASQETTSLPGAFHWAAV